MLEGVRAGTVSPNDALERLSELPYRDLGFARVDLHRELRQGAPEAVLAEGKTPEQVAQIFVALLEGGAGSVLATRADEAARAAVRALVPDAEEDALARCIWVARAVPEPRGWSPSCPPAPPTARSFARCGSARSFSGRPSSSTRTSASQASTGSRRRCRTSSAPTASWSSRGWTARSRASSAASRAAPVIGVPTSVGYGSAHGGSTALNAMLASCAAGLAVVGIDDGLGAGTIAARIARGRE